jgi:ABC-type polysaccharide/polyol phosphate transport system ATPase subunit
MKNPTIKVNSLYKEFKLFDNNIDKLLNIIPFINKTFKTNTALENINFEIQKGEFISIIGKNGSGKSTLLKILCGILKQTNGSFTIHGNVVSLIELSSGFESSLTGRENIIHLSKIMNFDLSKIYNNLQKIKDFAEIDEYFDMPVYTYSSGMSLRLAISLFFHLQPDIFIIDEALSVGDIFFQQKCFHKIEQMKKNNTTFLFVSHDISTVLQISDKVLLLENSKQIYFGDTNEACKIYYLLENKNIKYIKKNILKNTKEKNILKNKEQLKYNDKADITSLQIVNEKNMHTTSVKMTKDLIFKIQYKIHKELINSHINIFLKNKQNIIITIVSYPIKYNKQNIEIKIPFMLEAGEYSFDISIGQRLINQGILMVEYKNISIIQVLFDYQKEIAPFLGMIGLNTTIIYKD